MVPFNAALVVAHWGRIPERLLGPQPGEGREPPLEQRSVEQPGYSGASTTGHLITVIPPTATQRTDIRLTDIQRTGIPLPTVGLWISGLIGCSRFPRSPGLWIPSSGYPAYSGAPGYSSPIGLAQPDYLGVPGYERRTELGYPPYFGSPGCGDPRDLGEALCAVSGL
jgi:hypothetical protein